ncbi:hypothetical protein D3C78_1127630 [compost metagenome]
MPEQAIEHAGQAAEQARPAHGELHHVRHQAEAQGQHQQHQAALAVFDAPAQFPVPHAVHRQVQPAEVDQHRREQAPPLPRRQAFHQRREDGVVALDLEFLEGQPVQGRQVVAEQRDCRNDQRHQQHRGGHPAGTKLADESRGAPYRLGRQCEIRIAFGKALVKRTHFLGQLRAGHPEHLLAGLLADAERHIQAAQQADEPTQVDRQRQSHHFYSTHSSAPGRFTSTHTNLPRSRRRSPSSRYATSLPYITAL